MLRVGAIHDAKFHQNLLTHVGEIFSAQLVTVYYIHARLVPVTLLRVLFSWDGILLSAGICISSISVFHPSIFTYGTIIKSYMKELILYMPSINIWLAFELFAIPLQVFGSCRSDLTELGPSRRGAF